MKKITTRTLALATTAMVAVGCSSTSVPEGWRVTSTAPEAALKSDVAGDAATLYQQGKSHYLAGHYGLALQSFRKARAKDPRSIDILNGLGAAYDQIGRHEVAQHYYTEALLLDPSATATLNNLGYSLVLKGDSERGLAYLRKAAEAPSEETDTKIAQANIERLAPVPKRAPDRHEPAGDRGVVATLITRTSAQTPPEIATTEETVAIKPAVKVASTARIVRMGQRSHRLVTSPDPTPVPVEREGRTSAVRAIRMVETPIVAVTPKVPAVPALTSARAPDAPLAPAVKSRTPSVPEMPAVRPVKVTAAPLAPVAAPAAPVGRAPVAAAQPVQTAPVVTLAPQMPVISRVSVIEYPLGAPAPLAGRVNVSQAPVVRLGTEHVETTAAHNAPRPVAAPLKATRIMAAKAPPPDGPVSAPAAADSELFVEVSNGAGRRFLATRMKGWLESQGIGIRRLTNASSYSNQATVVFYRPGHADDAARVAAELPVEARLVQADGQWADVRIRLGGDVLEFDAGLIRESRFG